MATRSRSAKADHSHRVRPHVTGRTRVEAAWYARPAPTSGSDHHLPLPARRLAVLDAAAQQRLTEAVFDQPDQDMSVLRGPRDKIDVLPGPLRPQPVGRGAKSQQHMAAVAVSMPSDGRHAHSR